MKDCAKEEFKCCHYCIVCQVCSCKCNEYNHRAFNKNLAFSDLYIRKPECNCTGCKISREQEQMKPCVAIDERLEKIIYKVIHKILTALSKVT
jgi:hypothetical protein